MNIEKLKTQAKEIREMIIKKASNDGGHLASPLGVVEITQALVNVFDFTKDKIVFDVGHQAHAYKILTDRKERYFTMGKKNGIADYPDIHESEYDYYGVGHSATAVSAALAYSINSGDGKVVAFIGDGSLTGGECFEALNQVAEHDTDLLVIYNDNQKSIYDNVGSLSESNNLKKFSESLGFTYIGIKDGHDILELIDKLKWTKSQRKPIFLHISTIKGKGYKYAEKNPEKFHWTMPFNVNTGEFIGTDGDDTLEKRNYKKAKEYINKFKKVYFTTPSFPEAGLDIIKQEFPKKVIDTGMAEQHAVTFSSALALDGGKVFSFLCSYFLPRAIDQIIDVALHKINMVFILSLSGIAPSGPTHQGIYTFGILNMLPNIELYNPCNLEEYDRLLDIAVEKPKPIFIQSLGENIDFKFSDEKKDIYEILKGGKVTILPLGNMLQKAINISKKIDGASVLYAPILIPFNTELLSKYIKKSKKLIIIEDGFIKSGIGQHIVHELNQLNIDFKYEIFGIKDKFPIQGTMDEIFEDNKMTDDDIIEAIKQI